MYELSYEFINCDPQNSTLPAKRMEVIDSLRLYKSHERTGPYPQSGTMPPHPKLPVFSMELITLRGNHEINGQTHVIHRLHYGLDHLRVDENQAPQVVMEW